ncbi:outer membrane beta-barrel protein [Tundrisphaera sp. TA3]|uniref:outer membrane beta-barrel protein n=1 Tax=Tundrisphaera sp. TA3 TaxID=3435775 RepID=UPI003EB9ECD9
MNVSRHRLTVTLALGLAAAWCGLASAQQVVGSYPGQAAVAYDPGFRPVQAPAGDITATPRPTAEPDAASSTPPTPEGSTPEATSPSATGNPPTNETDLGIPRAEKDGEPTEATAEAEASEAPATDETKLLEKFLGREDAKVKIYGWIQNSFTGNANGRPKNGLNFGVNPNNLANQWMGNQYYLIFEKPLEQNDEINFGFRFDNLFGNDAQFNHAHGIFDRAFKPNYFSQYDPAQYYLEVHLPWFTEGGLDIRGGRFYTIAGYEVVPATGRPLLSVPYMFNYGQPFTHSGMLSTLHVTKNLNVYNGVINGWDRQFDQRLTWGYIGGFSWTAENGKTTLATTFISGPNQFPLFLPAGQNPLYPTGVIPPPPAFAGKRNPGYNSNERFLFTTVLTHKWTDKLTQVMEVDNGWETNVPFALGNTNGFNRQNAQWYGFGNWFLYQFSEKLTGVWRSEIFRDNNGVRTGYAGNFSEFTLGLIYKPKPYIWVRPEARYDFANEAIPYNDGTRTSQLTLGFDIILLF